MHKAAKENKKHLRVFEFTRQQTSQQKPYWSKGVREYS
jgi:hypothetical protein